MSRYFLVDGQNIAHVVDKLPYLRAKKADGSLEQLRAPNGEIVTVLKGMLNMIGSMVKQFGKHQIIVGFDGKEQTWRLGLDPLYKGGPKRIKELDVTNPEEAIEYLCEKFSRTGDSDVDKIKARNKARDLVEFRLQTQKLPEHLRAFGIQVLEQPSLEGDDIIALLTQHEELKNKQVLMYSNDKDILAYVSKTAYYYSPTVKSLVTPINFQDYVHKVFDFKTPISPNEWPLFRAMAGDRQDKILGVHNCGPKTAGHIIEQLKNNGARFTGYQQDSQDIIGQVIALRDSLPKGSKDLLLIEKNIDDLKHFYDLVRVNNAPEAEKKAITNATLTADQPVTEDQVKNKLSELGFKQWVNDVNWIRNILPDNVANDLSM